MNLRKYVYHISLNILAQSSVCPDFLRRRLYNLFGHHIEGTIGIGSFIGYSPEKKLILGGGSFTNARCFFDMCDSIIIGRNCCISYQGRRSIILTSPDWMSCY